jgi:hypothetical protein
MSKVEEKGEAIKNIEPPTENKLPSTETTPTPSWRSPIAYKPDAPPTMSKTMQRKQQNFSAGKPPKFTKDQLMKSEGVIPLQGGTNKFASQSGMTGFGTPRDIVDKSPRMY